ncbi:DASS family sodium-coupled anion symporter [Thauera sp.]|jgi:sodium-dependent dicarboxylate transporter 2/3/5|uniref:SLC13 family permease n=1 Tax=Thauera sp. TaxID=1905334 RepID=UPI002CE11AA8|nr:DASS family sodium-coupled anion symporter [Thauera sp.]HRO37831.1 DASS family sodium-coupled anion symporter [Thauera sp.]
MRNLNLVVAGVLFLGLQWGLDSLPDRAGAGLALLATIAWLWLTEALHVSVTALLVPLLAAASGVLAFPEALLQFADPVVFLFLGGFALAAGLQRQGLDRWMAGQVLRRAGASFGRAVRWLFWLTAFLSMWISNTATAAMMLPLALGLLAPLPLDEHRRTWMYVLLGVAFSANIGGIGTLVGSPPNAIAAAAVGMGFAEWMSWGLPLVLVMMPLMEIGLRLVLRPRLDVMVTPPPAPGGWTTAQQKMLALFGFTVLLWVFGAPLGAVLGFAQGYDAAVALLALVLLHGLRLAGWQDVERSTEWGVLLLFGGGLTLSKALAASGAAAWLATQLGGPLAALPAWVCIALMVLFALLLTEVTSNTASAALLIPLFLGLAPHVERAPLAVLVAVGTSCAFMLPVATPPNAIVFGSGHVPQRMMILGGSGVTVLVYPALVLAALIALA